jgi:hypothetical protein
LFRGDIPESLKIHICNLQIRGETSINEPPTLPLFAVPHGRTGVTTGNSAVLPTFPTGATICQPILICLREDGCLIPWDPTPQARSASSSPNRCVPPMADFLQRLQDTYQQPYSQFLEAFEKEALGVVDIPELSETQLTSKYGVHKEGWRITLRREAKRYVKLPR